VGARVDAVEGDALSDPAGERRAEVAEVSQDGPDVAGPAPGVLARRRQLFIVAGLHAEAADPSDEALARRARRLRVQVFCEWLALLVLLGLPVGDTPAGAHSFVFDGSERVVFALGIVVVAVHSGFCLAQWLSLSRLARELADLPLPPAG
jgi:hypothetical protein